MTVFLWFFLPVLLLFLVTALSIRRVLPILIRKKMGQTILEIGPRWHKSKEGTPTMGGIVFLPICALFLVILSLLLPYFSADESLLPVLLTGGFVLLNAAIGIKDDKTKWRHHKNAGLTPLQKILFQSLLAGVYLFLMRRLGFLSGILVIPFTDLTLQTGYFYDFFVLFLSVGIINCANLTDGVDGLLSSVAFPIGLSFALISVYLAQIDAYFFSLLLVALPLGFLIYNFHPAKLFMGDTGSLFFGALTVGCAMLLDRPLLLCILPLVFILEGVSDVIQVAYFKLTHGKRIFKMAPFHHHLEASGWKEHRIVWLFTLLSTLAGAVGFLSEVLG